jgi:hypothetical protein
MRHSLQSIDVRKVCPIRTTPSGSPSASMTMCVARAVSRISGFCLVCPDGWVCHVDTGKWLRLQDM